MNGIISGIISLMMMLSMSTGSGGPDSDAAQAAAEDFLHAMAAGNIQEAVNYVDEDTVSHIATIKDDEEATKTLYENLFDGFEAETVAVGTKNNVAVVKMNIKGHDFSEAQKAAEDEAYKYITSNLESDEVKDKDKLADKCLEIYLEKISEISKESDVTESTIYVPLVLDGHNQWRVLLNQELMKLITGNLELPNVKK
ncbi:MAG: DUF5105 domain-containing protein [Eubacterium sp.]|nr:DUF5105 domain-containing protein [Candidatus Colimonas fimequi]